MMDEKTKEEANHLTSEEELQVIQGNIINMTDHLIDLPSNIAVSIATSVMINVITSLDDKVLAHKIAGHTQDILEDLCKNTNGTQH